MRSTHLLFEGIPQDEITGEFLGDLMNVADDHNLSLEGISVRGEKEY